MSTDTKIYAFKTVEDATTSAQEMAADQYTVAVLGPTASVYLRDEQMKRSYWSRDDEDDIILVIGTKDGIDKVAQGGIRTPI
jgi:hypothetical protein